MNCLQPQKKTFILYDGNNPKIPCKQIYEFENYMIVYSMPIEVCKNSRANRCKICKDNIESISDKGYCVAQKAYYYRYKLHGPCCVSEIFQGIDITPASVHYIHYLQDIQQ